MKTETQQRIVDAAIKFFEAHRADYDDFLTMPTVQLITEHKEDILLCIDVEFMKLGDEIIKSNCTACEAKTFDYHGPHSIDCPENRK